MLPLDAFARCWVQEATLLRAVQAVLQGERAAAMARLTAAWAARRQATFDASMQVLAASLARTAAAREAVADGRGLGERLRQIGSAVARRLEPSRGRRGHAGAAGAWPLRWTPKCATARHA